MIDYVRGTLARKEQSEITVEAGGVGYAISVPLRLLDLLPMIGEEVKVCTWLYVREDTQRLYGFEHEAEREVFLQLLGISKIGPKVALNILSSVSMTSLVQAVANQDPTMLKGVSGVGLKTAQRLVMELRGKLEKAVPGIQAAQGLVGNDGAAPAAQTSARKDAYSAMLSLGYAEKQVEQALARVAQVIDPEATVEEWITHALQVI